ncbi:hypothetical protein BGX28_000882 [Mortierella sp. GBA30]|nr:hypothetical protein BGX28_000882 [Mortierella sp. GBA30]
MSHRSLSHEDTQADPSTLDESDSLMQMAANNFDMEVEDEEQDSVDLVATSLTRWSASQTQQDAPSRFSLPLLGPTTQTAPGESNIPAKESSPTLLPSHQDFGGSEKNDDAASLSDSEQSDDSFHILTYPTLPWGQRTRTRKVKVASTRLITSLLEEAESSTGGNKSGQGSRSHHVQKKNKRLARARSRSNSYTPSADSSRMNTPTPSEGSHRSLESAATPTITRLAVKKTTQIAQQPQSGRQRESSASMDDSEYLLGDDSEQQTSPIQQQPRQLGSRTKTTLARRPRQIVDLNNPAEKEPRSDIAENEPGNDLAERKPRSDLAEMEPRSGLAEMEPGSDLAEMEPGSGLAEMEPGSGLAETEPRNDLAQTETQPVSDLAEKEPRSEPQDDSITALSTQTKSEWFDCVMIPRWKRNPDVPRAEDTTPKPLNVVVSMGPLRRHTRSTAIPRDEFKTEQREPVRESLRRHSSTAAQSALQEWTCTVERVDNHSDMATVGNANRQHKGEGVSEVKSSKDRRATMPVSSPPWDVAKVFHGWWIQAKPSCGKLPDCDEWIGVHGIVHSPRTMVWHTSFINRAPEPTVVMTLSGSVYRLQGTIDQERMQSNGFPQDIIEAFKDGFPEDWRDILWHHFKGIPYNRVHDHNHDQNRQGTVPSLDDQHANKSQTSSSDSSEGESLRQKSEEKAATRSANPSSIVLKRKETQETDSESDLERSLGRTKKRPASYRDIGMARPRRARSTSLKQNCAATEKTRTSTPGPSNRLSKKSHGSQAEILLEVVIPRRNSVSSSKTRSCSQDQEQPREMKKNVVRKQTMGRRNSAIESKTNVVQTQAKGRRNSAIEPRKKIVQTQVMGRRNSAVEPRKNVFQTQTMDRSGSTIAEGHRLKYRAPLNLSLESLKAESFSPSKRPSSLSPTLQLRTQIVMEQLLRNELALLSPEESRLSPPLVIAANALRPSLDVEEQVPGALQRNQVSLYNTDGYGALFPTERFVGNSHLEDTALVRKKMRMSSTGNEGVCDTLDAMKTFWHDGSSKTHTYPDEQRQQEHDASTLDEEEGLESLFIESAVTETEQENDSGSVTQGGAASGKSSSWFKSLSSISAMSQSWTLGFGNSSEATRQNEQDSEAPFNSCFMGAPVETDPGVDRRKDLLSDDTSVVSNMDTFGVEPIAGLSIFGTDFSTASSPNNSDMPFATAMARTNTNDRAVDAVFVKPRTTDHDAKIDPFTRSQPELAPVLDEIVFGSKTTFTADDEGRDLEANQSLRETLANPGTSSGQRTDHDENKMSEDAELKSLSDDVGQVGTTDDAVQRLSTIVIRRLSSIIAAEGEAGVPLESTAVQSSAYVDDGSQDEIEQAFVSSELANDGKKDVVDEDIRASIPQEAFKIVDPSTDCDSEMTSVKGLKVPTFLAEYSIT